MPGCANKKEEMGHRSDVMKENMYGRERSMWLALRGIGLYEKQKEQIRDILVRLIKDTVRKRADMRIAEIDLESILAAGPVDMRGVEAKLKAVEDIKSKLTPEQKEKHKKNLKRQWQRLERIGLKHTGWRSGEMAPSM